PVADVESLEKTYRRRRRHWQYPVRGLHRSIAQRNAGIVHALDAQQLNAPQGADDIENRVDGADFVEMEIIGRDAMDRSLNGRDGVERGVGAFADFVRNRYRVDQPMNLRHRAPVRLWRNVEIDLHAPYRRALDVSDAHADTIEPERRRQSRQPHSVETVVDESADEQVAGEP